LLFVPKCFKLDIRSNIIIFLIKIRANVEFKTILTKNTLFKGKLPYVSGLRQISSLNMIKELIMEPVILLE
jgi:hypothetical protein